MCNSSCIGNVIIPTDELIFFRGVQTTNQVYLYIYMYYLYIYILPIYIYYLYIYIYYLYIYIYILPLYIYILPIYIYHLYCYIYVLILAFGVKNRDNVVFLVSDFTSETTPWDDLAMASMTRRRWLPYDIRG